MWRKWVQNTPHFVVKDECLIFYEYDRRTSPRTRVLGYLFYFSFVPIWATSILLVPGIVLALLRGYWSPLITFATLVVYTYAPLPRRFDLPRLLLFLIVPQYFDEASYRVMSPSKWPEMKVVLDMLEESSSSSGWFFPPLMAKIRAVQSPPRVWLFHPHGLNANGWGSQAFNPYFPKLEMCISSLLYYTPLITCYTSHCGKPSPCDGKTIKYHLSNGRSVAVILGGFEEATIHPNKGDRVYLKNRTGIFKYALEFGAEVVPVFTFGECDMYSNLQGCWRLRLWLNSKSIPAMVPFGRLPFPWMPRPFKFHTVVGEPITVKRVKCPTPSDVAELHGQYTRSLREIYDKFKRQFYGPDFNLQLEVW